MSKISTIKPRPVAGCAEADTKAAIHGKSRPGAGRWSRSARGFVRDESGSIIIFSLFLLAMMLMFAGLAVDMAIHESARVRLQNTVDRAILAAADLDQTLDPESVVQDYFAKAGMSQHLTGIEVVEGLNYRSVRAVTSANVDTIFALGARPDPLPGEVTRLSDWYGRIGEAVWVASAQGTAEQGFTDIEISLVLDVSGSMGRNNRIENLRPAANEFIETVLSSNTSAEGALTSVSLIPYNATVNMGATLAGQYNLADFQSVSYCARFHRNDFTRTGISPTARLDRIAHFEADNGRSTPIRSPWCSTGNYRGNEVVPLSIDVGSLQSAVNNLTVGGWTSIDNGIKWASALLDPGTQTVVAGLIDQNAVADNVAGRPFAYGNQGAMKIIVVMSDGANTKQYDIEDDPDGEAYKTGMSPIWVQRDFAGQPLQDIARDQFSIRYDDGGTPGDHTDDSFMRREVSSGQREIDYPHGYPDYNAQADSPESNGLVSRLSWADLYAVWEAYRLNREHLLEARDLGYITDSAYQGPDRAVTLFAEGAGADARLSDICDSSKSEGVIIYAVAFEAPSAGEAALLDCASSAAHYFDVEGTDIADAFSAIASDIVQLRLTQ